MKYLVVLFLLACANYTIEEKILPSLIEVTNEEETYCSAFVLEKHLVITASHCVGDKKEINLRFKNKSFVGIVVKNVYEESENGMDAALLFVTETLTPAKIGDSNKIKVGEDVILAGHPMGLTNSVSKGIISNTSRKRRYGIMIQSDVLANPGNSGGPLYNMDGEVIGMLVRAGEGISLSYPINEVLRRLK